MDPDKSYEENETECEFFMNTCHCSNNFFHFLDVLVGTLIVCDAFYLFTQIDSFIGFLLPIYFVIFGCLICMFVLYVPSIIIAILPFYFNFLGRGLLFFFIGSIIFVFDDEFSVITGVMTWIVSLTYILISVWIRYCQRFDFGFALPVPITQRNDDEDGENQQNYNRKTVHTPKPIETANDREQTPSTTRDHDNITQHELEKKMKYRMDLEADSIQPIDMEIDAMNMNDDENDGDGNNNNKRGDKREYGVVAAEDDLL